MTSLVIISAILICLLLLPYTVRFFIALCGSIFQIYHFTAFGFTPSLALLAQASLSTTTVSFWRNCLQPPIIIMLALILVQTISLTWSVDRHWGRTTIIYEIPFIIMYVVSYSMTRLDVDCVVTYLKCYAILSLIPLAVIIRYAINSKLNWFYITSPIAHVFNHPYEVSWYLKSYISWNGKPRGIIFDTNAAGGFLGVCSLSFFALGIYCRALWLKCIAILNWIGLLFTKVFAAQCLGLIIPYLIMTAYFYGEKKKTILFGVDVRRLIIYITTLIIIALITIAIDRDIVLFAEDKLYSRLNLWAYALRAILEHPWKGGGFGYLAQYYQYWHVKIPTIHAAVDNPGFKPHNTLIAIWSQSGILALVLAISFMVSVFYACYRAYRKTASSEERLLVLCVSGAVLWMILHAMVENWGIVSEKHIQIIIATMFGWMMALFSKTSKSIRLSK